jgi:hypothetical protein
MGRDEQNVVEGEGFTDETHRVNPSESQNAILREPGRACHHGVCINFIDDHR